jgi:N-hydroxyarylamine O-acetyltransferase
MLDGAFVRYLARLGVEPEPPSLDALARLHRAHVETVPWETVWIHLGESRGIDPSESIERIARGRGGYCFHLNGALAELLAALGYEVTRHVGGVHGPAGPSEEEMGNHLVLVVHGLPTAENPDGHWYVDAGLGDALHEPLALRPHTARQGPFALTLDSTPGALGDWHLAHDPAGGFAGMAWRSTVVGIDAFQPMHIRLSTSPESGFVRTLSAQRRDSTGVDVLRGLTLRRQGVGESTRTLESRAELDDVLCDLFGLDLSDVEPSRIEALWDRTRTAHLDWLAAGSP